MRPGIVAATAAEARILKNGPIRTERLIQLPHSLLVVCGMGANRARCAAQTLVQAGAQGLISWGTAGALLPGIPSGTLILPERILAGGGEIFTPDPAWRGALGRRLADIPSRSGVLAESQTVLARGAEKEAFRERTGALAVDMESAAVARVARERGVAFVAIRVIMDEAESEIRGRILRRMNEFGRMPVFSLIALLAGHPGEVRHLVRLARNFQAARSTLRLVARRAGGGFEISGATGCRNGSNL